MNKSTPNRNVVGITVSRLLSLITRLASWVSRLVERWELRLWKARLGDDIIIFDTTLRDGEQSPGASMSPREKAQLAKQLVKLGVNVIEAGFPVSSPRDFKGVIEVAKVVGSRAVLAVLARCRDEDVDAGVKALIESRNTMAGSGETIRPRVHLFLATSKLHRNEKLKLSVDQLVEKTTEFVAKTAKLLEAAGLPVDIEFSPEDASRTELDVLVRVVDAAIRAGARTINLPDTVGYATPEEYGYIFAHLRRMLPSVDHLGVVLSAHCHNDLGLGVANALAAIRNGARQVECTIVGIGERAGNTAVEAFVMAAKLRYGFKTTIDTRQFGPSALLLQELTGLDIARNTPVVGENAFAHEAGIHQHGVKKGKQLYEIMSSDEVGWRGTRYVLGSHSGRAGIMSALEPWGMVPDETELDFLYQELMRITETNTEVFDTDLLSLLNVRRGQPVGNVHSVGKYRLLDGENGHRTAVISITGPNGSVREVEATGDGPLHALFLGIRSHLGIEAELTAFRVKLVNRGEGGLAETTVELTAGDESFRGRGSDPDIIRSCLMAYMHAANRMKLAAAASVAAA